MERLSTWFPMVQIASSDGAVKSTYFIAQALYVSILKDTARDVCSSLCELQRMPHASTSSRGRLGLPESSRDELGQRIVKGKGKILRKCPLS